MPCNSLVEILAMQKCFYDKSTQEHLKLEHVLRKYLNFGPFIRLCFQDETTEISSASQQSVAIGSLSLQTLMQLESIEGSEKGFKVQHFWTVTYDPDPEYPNDYRRFSLRFSSDTVRDKLMARLSVLACSQVRELMLQMNPERLEHIKETAFESFVDCSVEAGLSWDVVECPKDGQPLQNHEWKKLNLRMDLDKGFH